MKYIVAVSGGVDSVVLLHMLVQQAEHELVVAHFDHGIRTDSAADARFVEGLARLYSLPFVVKREELGPGTSEETARLRRYAFLRDQAKTHTAQLVTAHHANDTVETIAINLIRGTGWRGVAVLDASDVVRPLLGKAKKDIVQYALNNRLEWVEDSTNTSDRYLRNRMRRKISHQLTPEKHQQLLRVWNNQITLKREIDALLTSFVHPDALYDRYDFIMLDWPLACELLRAVIVAKAGVAPTRPQLDRALMAIRTAQPSTMYEVGSGVRLQFSSRTFLVQTP